MSYYEPSGKDIKFTNHSTPITSNDFFNRKQIIQKEKIDSSQMKLRNINLLNNYTKASKSLSELGYVQVTKPVFQNSVLNKAFNAYQSETKMKYSFSHSYIDIKAKQKSNNHYEAKRQEKIAKCKNTKKEC